MEDYLGDIDITIRAMDKASAVIDDIIKATEVSSRDFPEVYARLGIDLKRLGCVMMDIRPQKVTEYVENGEDDLFYEDGWGDGAVGEKSAHVTLLFGLLQNANFWKQNVDAVLNGWSLPVITFESVDAFEMPDSYCIVAHVTKDIRLLEGHNRLTLLPHINTFLEYKPHVSLAYVKKEPALRDKWVAALSEVYTGKRVPTTGLNYGDPDR